MKGGAAGGGWLQVLPWRRSIPHFTGDFTPSPLAHIDDHAPGQLYLPEPQYGQGPQRSPLEA